MAEKTPNQQLAEKLLYKPAYVADKDADVKQKAHDFAEGYKKFLDAGKTEREVAAESEQMLKDAGYQQFDPKKTYKPGDKIYFVQCNKAVVASTIGTKSFEDGFHLVIAHTDSPRLDLRPTPLYESDHLSYFKTHYYGGIRKYQWGTIPLSIHGVFTREDGSTVTVRVGEDENDPVFCITDLLPHLGAEQNARPLKDGIKAEELNILIGSDAVDDENVKEAVKLNTMILLNEKYGITEKEFMRAEIEITPAYKSRDVGFDRSMVGGYGHDDRVDAYPALMAEIETKNPAYTTVCVLTDKEEIGSDGVTGMQSMYAFHFMPVSYTHLDVYKRQVRGGGDLATGVVHRLWSAGLRVLVLETAHPAAIRRQVSLCEAVYEGETAVEGMRGIRVETLADADAVWAQNAVPVLIDPTGACLPQARPFSATP